LIRADMTFVYSLRMSASRTAVPIRIMAGATGLLAVAGCVAGCLGGLINAVTVPEAIGLLVVALVAAWLTVRFTVAATQASIVALLKEFVDAVDAGDYPAAHRLLYSGTRQRLSVDELAGRFPDRLTGVRVVRIQLTRNLDRSSPVRRIAKLAVRIGIHDNTTADYLFFLVQEGRTWTVDQWVADGEWELIDYQFE
jgi:hypothetical protein